jgi:hypothetical protein
MKTAVAFALLACLLFTGCASGTKRPLAERGWIGSEYAVARNPTMFPRFSYDKSVRTVPAHSLPPTRTDAIMVTRLATNTPAALAGLHQGDFILELNHRPVTSLQGFRRVIDRTPPGTPLPLRIYREGQFVDCTVPVGCEKYRAGGLLSIAFPTVVHSWDLWPDPGFSLVVLGYEPNPGLRHDLGRNPDQREVYDEEWSIFVGCLEVSAGKRVVAQELEPAHL